MGKTPRLNWSDYEKTTSAPEGLTLGHVEDKAALKAALEEVESVFDYLNQIASNRHFFVNLSFPLLNDIAREKGTPTLALDDSRIANLVGLVRGLVDEEERLKRANVIVREYRLRQHISFHVDDLKCENDVYGLVLLNQDPNGKGLSFIKGGGSKKLLYTLAETAGTTFCMRNQARYAWKHGIFPVTHRRISVTVRILKAKYVEQYERNELEQEEKGACLALSRSPASLSGETVVCMCDNRKPSKEKPVRLSATVDLAQLCEIAMNKFRIKPKMNPRFYVDGGDGRPLQNGQQLCESQSKIFVVVLDEKFQGRVNTVDNSAKEEAETDPILRYNDIKRQFQIWNDWRYPRLEFTTRRLRQGSDISMEPVERMEVLDSLIQGSYLSVPELRELSFGIQESVFERQSETGLCLGFSTGQDEQQRHTCIYVLDPNGEVLEFRVTGKPTLKGRKKRDGPLWAFQGGLNNPREQQKQHLQQVNKDANAYQQKRGVVVTDAYVLFAGTTWLSSYYTCDIELDGHTFTSVAQYVLYQQASIFGDKEREAEILAIATPAAPHKLYDHKAPKTGERQVKGFDADVWKEHGDRLMWKATWAKFSQNKALRAKLLETGTRKIVESTDDLVWGSGIAINHQHATNEKKWSGENRMGALLMSVRDELRAIDSPKLIA